MLVDQLRIQRFRGVSGTLKLDLSAPLTVIYAPNGTGKTSICDAVEWILCGDIGRLSSLAKEDVRCRFGGEHIETLVEADIPHLNKPFSIKRVLTDSGSKLFWKDEACDYKLASDEELLRRIVSALPPSGNSAKAKVAWVRSTRFLESDSLSLLIDSDKESNDTRKLIFSNLFGVSEYQKAENDLNKILNKLPAISTITKEKAKISKKIAEYDEYIKKLVAEQSEPYRDHASNLLNTIAERLGQKENTNKDVDILEYHKQLEIEFIQINDYLTEQKSNLLFIRENINYYLDSLSKSEELEKNIKVDGEILASLNHSLKNKKQELEEKQTASKHREELIHKISEAIKDLKTESTTYNLWYELYTAPSLEVGKHETRLSKISEYVTLGEQKIASLNERVFLVEKYIELLPTWLKNRERLSGINIELEALQARNPKNSDEKSLAEKISDVKAELDTLQFSREKTLGELELLLSSGKRYVEVHTHNSECPLCEHKYESNLLLQEKINSRFSKLSNKSKEEASLVSKHEELTKQLLRENDRLKQFQELTNQKNKLAQDIEKAEDGFVALGIAMSEIIRIGDISKRLEDIREQHLNTIKEIIKNLTPYKSAYDAAKHLEEMLIRINSLSSSWHQKFEQHIAEPSTIDNLGKAIIDVESLLEKQNKLKKQLHEEEKLELLKISSELLKLEEEKSTKSSVVSTSKENRSAITNFLQDFKRKWAIISSAPDINDHEIEKTAISIDDKSRILNEAKSLFEKIEYYFDKIRESEKKERECGLYKKEVHEAQKQLQEWSNQESARLVIEKEIRSIKEKIRCFISQEIKPLSNIINTLYLRAQGNRFINSIEAKPSEDGFLNWIAELDENGQTLEKMLSLSQGQRQDLALAIFLARARSLGGTFFLDEPLAHLDDLNRVALLDTLRIIVSEKRVSALRLVLTTASNNLLRHLREKFSLVESEDGSPALRIYKISGNPKVGIDVELPELVHSPNRLLTNS